MEEVNSGGTRLVDGAKAITQSFDFHAEVSLIFGYKLHGFTDATHVDRDGVFGHWFSVCRDDESGVAPLGGDGANPSSGVRTSGLPIVGRAGDADGFSATGSDNLDVVGSGVGSRLEDGSLVTADGSTIDLSFCLRGGESNRQNQQSGQKLGSEGGVPEVFHVLFVFGLVIGSEAVASGAPDINAASVADALVAVAVVRASNVGVFAAAIAEVKALVFKLSVSFGLICVSVRSEGKSGSCEDCKSESFDMIGFV